MNKDRNIYKLQARFAAFHSFLEIRNYSGITKIKKLINFIVVQKG